MQIIKESLSQDELWIRYGAVRSGFSVGKSYFGIQRTSVENKVGFRCSVVQSFEEIFNRDACEELTTIAHNVVPCLADGAKKSCTGSNCSIIST